MHAAASQGGLRVRVCIPHFVREQDGDRRYGSGQPDARARRALALGRCLGALLDLQRGPEDCLLHIAAHAVQRLPGCSSDAMALPPLSLSVTVCSDGVHQLDEVLEQFGEAIALRRLVLEDPRDLALASRDLLLGRDPHGNDGEPDADLFLYLEDDLVIRDPLYLDKIAWFLERADHEWVLMPQRYERLHRDGLGVMLVDGPLRRPPTAPRPIPAHLARLRLPGQPEVRLEIPRNPHAGSFCLSRLQVRRLRDRPLARAGFISPLETAATLTVAEHFPVLKPVPRQWRFLCLEHAHAGFAGLRDQWPQFGAPPERS